MVVGGGDGAGRSLRVRLTGAATQSISSVHLTASLLHFVGLPRLLHICIYKHAISTLKHSDFNFN